MPKRRANNEGSIWYNEKKQLWNAAITTPGGNRPTKASKDKQVVIDWLNEQRLLVGRRQNIEPNKLTVFEWITEWLATYAKIKVAPRTYDGYVTKMKHFEPIYNEKLISLKPVDLQRIYNSMEDDYAPRTIIHANNCMSGCMEQAVENKLITENITKKTKKPKADIEEIEIYTPEEIKALTKAAQNYENSFIISLVYTTGCRLSEILALSCEHFNAKEDVICIRRAIHSSTSGGIYYGNLKTVNSKRDISVPRKIMLELEKHKKKYGITSGSIFLSIKGKPLTPSYYLKSVFSKIQDEAKTNKGFHCFRHTHATELLAMGVPIHDVSKRLGHAKVSTTLNIYAHFMPRSDETMRLALDKLMKNKAKKTVCNKSANAK